MRKCLRIWGVKSDNLSNELVESTLFNLVDKNPSDFFKKWVNNKQKDTDWRYGKIIAGKVTPDFTAFLLGLPKPTDTEVYNKMTPFFTIALDNGFWSAHYGTELSKE